MQIFLKKDFMQYTGSFKERGARYTLLMLSREQQEAGVIAASAGNHAQALAYHGGQLGKSIKIRQYSGCRSFEFFFRYPRDRCDARYRAHHEDRELQALRSQGHHSRQERGGVQDTRAQDWEERGIALHQRVRFRNG